MLEHLFEYNAWANARLLEFCEPLNAEQLATSAVGTYGRLDDTLVHILAAEQGYLKRLSGEERPARLRTGERPAVADLRQQADECGRLWQQLLRQADEEWLNGAFETEWGGEMHHLHRAIVLTQCLHHGNDHRAHCCVILTQLGLEPPVLDAWAHGDAKFG
jgi:uncharacterized damage-inducible protein DinB